MSIWKIGFFFAIFLRIFFCFFCYLCKNLTIGECVMVKDFDGWFHVSTSLKIMILMGRNWLAMHFNFLITQLFFSGVKSIWRKVSIFYLFFFVLFYRRWVLYVLESVIDQCFLPMFWPILHLTNSFEDWNFFL